MPHLPFYISLVFVLTAIVTVYLFYKASGKNIKFLIIVATWTTVLSAIAATGFFTVTDTLPPRFLLVILLPVIGMVVVFSTRKGRAFVDGFDTGLLTLLHSVRIPVEMVLFWLFLNKLMPQLMTFEGRNFDLFSGITAPVIYYFGFIKKKLGIKTLIAWNAICTIILLFTMSNAILSSPTPFQQFAFDQPTIGVMYFPFVWLPGVVAPLVLFSHFITIRLLLKEVRHKTISVAAVAV